MSQLVSVHAPEEARFRVFVLAGQVQRAFACVKARYEGVTILVQTASRLLGVFQGSTNFIQSWSSEIIRQGASPHLDSHIPAAYHL